MEWSEYVERFSNEALSSGHGEEYVAICLRYARTLFSNGMPIIYDDRHFARLVGYQYEFVRRAAYGAPYFYRRFSVKKIRGGLRRIAEPLPSLKEIQRWILDNILTAAEPSRYAKGFVKGRSVKDNARFHRNQPKVLSMDVKDFFPSIGRERIYALFRLFEYSQPASNLLARLCSLDGSLPQGAPTSPAISNLVARRLDMRLAGFALKRQLRFTRYADDITFSGEFHPGQVVRFARRVLKEEGFELNEAKTRLVERHQRQEVTGVVVNEHMQAPRSSRRALRQAMHYIEKYGLNSHLDHTRNHRANYVRHLLGVANFIQFVNPDDASATAAMTRLRALLRPDDDAFAPF